MNLKFDYDLLSVNAVVKELWARGIQAEYSGEAKSFDGSYVSKEFVDHRAFCIVCTMLCGERVVNKRTGEELAQQKGKARRWKWLSIILSIACIALLVACIRLSNANNALENDVTQLNAELSSAKSSYIVLNSKYELSRKSRDKLSNKLSVIEDEYAFYHDHAVVVTTTGEKYHRYDCYHIADRSFFIYNTEYAEWRGYEPCLDCFG